MKRSALVSFSHRPWLPKSPSILTGPFRLTPTLQTELTVSFQQSGAPNMDPKEQDPSYTNPKIGPLIFTSSQADSLRQRPERVPGCRLWNSWSSGWKKKEEFGRGLWSPSKSPYHCQVLLNMASPAVLIRAAYSLGSSGRPA